MPKKTVIFIWKQRESQIYHCHPLYFRKRWLSGYTELILPVVLYGYKMWSLTLKEEGKLQKTEDEVLSRIFGSKKHERCEQCGTLREEKQHECAGHLVLLWCCNLGGCGGLSLWLESEGREVHVEYRRGTCWKTSTWKTRQETRRLIK
jgi:hypothetical protein